jgi:hypothetical protein
MTCGKRLAAPAAAAPVAPPSTMPVAPVWRSTAQAPAATTYDSATSSTAPTYSNTTTFNIWGPFAGYGTRGRHVAWLINDHGAQADALREVVRARFERREIPDASVDNVVLTRRGIMVDSRPYFLLRRKLATAGLYISQFGQDLYVSQVTYFKGPISNARTIMVIILLLSFFLTPILMGGRGLGFLSGFTDPFGLTGSRRSSDSSGLSTLLLCCFGPLFPIALIAVPLILAYSFYKWLTERDIEAVLRTTPNEFDTDDIVSLEKSVEQTVRESLDVVGIEQQLMPPADEYGFRRRLI